MWRNHWILSLAVLTVGMMGCGGSDSTGQSGGNTHAERDTPEAAVAEFLEAVRNGDDEKTARMLTAAARKTTAELGLEVAPPGSDTAQFEVGKAEYLSPSGARVACTLSDLDENSQRQTERLVWMVRREPEGWRIAGVAATVVEGEPPRAVDFENPRAMAALGGRTGSGNPPSRRPETSRDATARQPRYEDFPARESENSGGPIRR
jgi:hypothetical protein